MRLPWTNAPFLSGVTLLLTAYFSIHTQPSSAADFSANLENACDRAAILAARESGVPLPVLLAITRTETSRDGAPWPWTINLAGTGAWFETRHEAEAFATRNYAEGVRSFDIGCFQINHRWHGEHFTSIGQMFDPEINAAYAARYLTTLYQEFDSWDGAVGAYHSRTPRHATRYVRIYHNHLAEMRAGPHFPPPGTPSPSAETAAIRDNSFPLLQGGRSSSAASLMPGRASSVQPLFSLRP